MSAARSRSGGMKTVAALSRKLARTLFHQMVKFGPKLEKRQVLLARLADIGSDLFALSASCVLAQKLLKDGEHRYIIGKPQEGTSARLWNLPVVETQAIIQDEFLTGAFNLAAQIYDRMAIEVLISTENDKDFENNMVSIRAEERLAFTVYRPEAFVTGSLSSS